jgi:hypothetical protein
MSADAETDHQGPSHNEQVVCSQCQEQIPADLAIQPEGEEYALYFCTPECFAKWRAEKADPLEREHRAHSGTDQGR